MSRIVRLNVPKVEWRALQIEIGERNLVSIRIDVWLIEIISELIIQKINDGGNESTKHFNSIDDWFPSRKIIEEFFNSFPFSSMNIGRSENLFTIISARRSFEGEVWGEEKWDIRIKRGHFPPSPFRSTETGTWTKNNGRQQICLAWYLRQGWQLFNFQMGYTQPTKDVQISYVRALHNFLLNDHQMSAVAEFSQTELKNCVKTCLMQDIFIHRILLQEQNSPYNFIFSPELWYHKGISLNIDIIIDNYPCLDIKILLTILFSHQNCDILWEFCLIQTSLSTSPLVSKSKFCFEFCFLSRILSEFWYRSRILSETDMIIYTVPLSRYQNSAWNFAFPAEFCQNSDIWWEFCLIQTSLSTPSPCLQIKILLRILFSHQNFVRILIFYENFVWYRHDDRHLPLSWNQNSAWNFAFPPEFCLIQTLLSTSPLVLKSKFCFEFCFLSRILSEFWYRSRILSETDMIIYTSPCLDIKILLRILLFQQNFVRIVISQQNFACDFPSYCWSCGCDCWDCGSFRSYCGCDISFDCCSHYGCCSCCGCCKCHRCCGCRTYCCCCDYKIDKGSCRSWSLCQAKFCCDITILTKFWWKSKIPSRILILRQEDGVDNDVCIKQNSHQISEFWQNSAEKAKFQAEFWYRDKGRCR